MKASAVRRLAIVGASARAAAQSALRAGCEVVAADLFADADLAAHCEAARIADYPAGFAEWLARADCDAWLYTGGLENYPDLVDRLAAARPLLGNAGDALRRVRDPLAWQQAAITAGLHVPETRRSAAGLPLDGSWLAKTYRSAGGLGVWALDGRAALDRAKQSAAFVQRYVEGTPAAAVYACYGDAALVLGLTRQVLGGARRGGRAWQYAGSVGPLAADAAVVAQLARLGSLLVEEFGLRGLVGVDLVLEGGRAWIVEVNPRYPASAEIIERASGASMFAAHRTACGVGRPSDHAASARGASAALATDAALQGKQIVFASRDVTVSAAFARWALAEALEPAACRLGDIPRAGESIRAGHPVLTAFASAPAAEYDAAIAARVAEVEQRLDARRIP